MVLRYPVQRPSVDESVGGQLPVLCGQLVDRQSQVIQLIELRQDIGRLFQADLLHARRARELLDHLVHRVEAGSRKVCPGVGQALGVVRVGGFD